MAGTGAATAGVAPGDLPFTDEQWRAGLAAVAASSRSDSRRFADLAVKLATIADRVPRRRGDSRGGTAWTSFLREVAVARRITERAATSEVAIAQQLVSCLPQALSLLRQGELPVAQARALAEETAHCDRATAEQVDRELSARACSLATWRLRQAVQRLLLALDADAAAARAARATAARDVTLAPLADDQAVVTMTGPALAIAAWYTALDRQARALRAAGDPRTLDALRFDLATSTGTPAAPSTPAGTGADAHDGSGTGGGTPADLAELLRAGAAAAAAAAAAQNADTEAAAHTDAVRGADADDDVAETFQGHADDADEADDEAAVASEDDAHAGVPVPVDAAAAGDPVHTGARPGTGPAAAPVPVPVPASPASPADLTGSPERFADCRLRRPVQLLVHVTVETALGLSNEPGWLDGVGWISAPQVRQLLPIAELRQLCQTRTGQVIDLADRPLRPPPTPSDARAALLTMATEPFTITTKTWRTEAQHDPSPALREFVTVRDRFCDGPTQPQVRAEHCDTDHQQPHPEGPTAAWNLTARARRTHALKHYGWTPINTPTGTLWISPAGQLFDVDRHTTPTPTLPPDAQLPDPDALHALEAELLRQPDPDQQHPIAPPLPDEPPF